MNIFDVLSKPHSKKEGTQGNTESSQRYTEKLSIKFSANLCAYSAQLCVTFLIILILIGCQSNPTPAQEAAQLPMPPQPETAAATIEKTTSNTPVSIATPLMAANTPFVFSLLERAI